MNASPWKLQWPERADTVEQRRPWGVKCTRLGICGQGIEVEGPERYAESRTGPAVSEACSQSITWPPHATPTTVPRPTSPFETTMVVSAVALIPKSTG